MQDTAIGKGIGSFFDTKAGSKLLDIGGDVAAGTVIGGVLDYFDRKNQPDSPELKSGRTAEEIAEIESGLRAAYKNLGYSEGEIDLLVEQNMKEYRAEGGRIGYSNGTDDSQEFKAYRKAIADGTFKGSFDDFLEYIDMMRDRDKTDMAEGGRIGYSEGSEDYEEKFMKLVSELREAGFSQQEAIEEARERLSKDMAYGGRISYAMGTDEKVEMASGIEGIPININPQGIKELDFRKTGGFVPPVGVKEKADDIPAMLSNNEFVFTADAVRAAGGGDVDKGAQRMYDTMKKLESRVA